jgi:hypothetical protein
MADDSQPEKKEAERYDAEYLVANARSLLGAPPMVAQGALSAEDRKTHTVEQAKRSVAQYLKRPVEVDNEPEDDE